MIAEAAREYQDRRAEQSDADGGDREQRRPITEHGARRQPHRAADLGHVCDQPSGLQRRKRQAAVGKDGGDLQPNDEGRPDHCRHHLRDETRALGANCAEERDGERYSKSYRHCAHGGYDAKRE